MSNFERPIHQRHLTSRAPILKRIRLSLVALGALFPAAAMATAPPTASFPTQEEVDSAPLDAPAFPATPKKKATHPVSSASTAEPTATTQSEATGSSAAAQWRRLPPVSNTNDNRSTTPSATTRDSAVASEAPLAPEVWIWSLEGVSRAPVDVGLQTVFETPFGLRLGGGWAWVPSAYLDFVTQASGTDDGNVVAALDGGRTLRGFVGLRPSKKLGIIFDAGYTRVRLTGTLEDPGLIQGVSLGRFDLQSNLDMWFVELGYQGHVGRHAILGIGLGLMGTLNANTEATPVQSGQSSVSEALTQEATDTVDSQIERYGFVPTLTLRIGFDLI